MKYVSLPCKSVRELPFYLSMEEYVARKFKGEDLFFMWQVEPTVIFGRNQLIDNEVNIEYCKANNIATYRRKSGGGCVYADMDNIMFSYVTDSENVTLTFDKYISMVVAFLQGIGLNAVSNGRNDILIDGKKVSGNAFYHIPGRSIVHGTMLFNTQMENMVKAITPSNAKLISKGVESVRNHITTLNRYLTIDINEFKRRVRSGLCDGEIILDKNDIEEINEIEKEYLTNDFIYGMNPRFRMSKNIRYDGVGEFIVYIDISKNRIKDINFVGDYFLVGDIGKEVFERLIDINYDEDSIRKALENVVVENIILNLNKEQLIKLII